VHCISGIGYGVDMYVWIQNSMITHNCTVIQNFIDPIKVSASFIHPSIHPFIHSFLQSFMSIIYVWSGMHSLFIKTSLINCKSHQHCTRSASCMCSVPCSIISPDHTAHLTICVSECKEHHEYIIMRRLDVIGSTEERECKTFKGELAEATLLF